MSSAERPSRFESAICQFSNILNHGKTAKKFDTPAARDAQCCRYDLTLQRVEDDGPSFARDIWLVVHRDLKNAGSVRAVMDFLVDAVGSRFAQDGVAPPV